LKFYQASYDEGFVDVLFHTNISKKINFGIGVSNSAIDSRFNNSDYESWKIDGNISYLINEKTNITFNYFFTYDTLALFGGLDTNVIMNKDFSTVLYESKSNNSLRHKLNYNNSANVKILSTLIPNSKTDLTFYINSNSQEFRQNTDSLVSNLPTIKHDSYLQTFGIRFQNYYNNKNTTINLTALYETTTLDANYTANKKDENILSVAGKGNYLFSKLFVPSIFGKISSFNGDILLGYGIDFSGTFNSFLSYYAGFSRFQKESSILENYYPIGSFPFNATTPAQPSDNNTIEIGLKLKTDSFMGRLSYFNYSSKNSLIPHSVSSGNDTLLINEVSYFSKENINNSGINFSFSFNFWKFLFSNSLSYYLGSSINRGYASPDYTLAGKLYYFDNLFNNNLAVKAGINYRVIGGQSPFIYDSENLFQIQSQLTSMVAYSNIPPSFQLDLYMAGTIQERATIFVTFENLLDAEYYIAPYYFKQPLTLRFGVSWLLFD
jgi:hypothetical protein